METIIEENTYKRIKYTIKFATGDGWTSGRDKFIVDGSFSWSEFHQYKNIEDLRNVIKEDIDDWYSIQPQTEDDWLSLVENCVIQDDYEIWHVNKVMIMEVLEKYSKFKSVD